MTTLNQVVGAPLARNLTWKSIDWKTVEYHVEKLQLRIAKAIKLGRYRKAKALQWLLTHSFYAKLLAVKRISQNKGKNTPGIDRVIWRTSYQKMQAAKALKRKGYRSLPLRRIHIPKWILEGDIRSCFDKICHKWLENNVRMDKRILRQWLKAGYIEKDSFYHTESGTPQGGIISPVLSNIALDGLEQVVKSIANAGDKINFVRYADDWICTAKSREILEQKVQPKVVQFLKERGLELSEEKTKITHIDKGFDFLGFNLRKYKGKLLIIPILKNKVVNLACYFRQKLTFRSH